MTEESKVVPVIMGTQVQVEDKSLNKKQIRTLFFSSLLNLAILAVSLCFAYLKNGNVDWKFGLIYFLILGGSFTASVYGQYDYRNMKKNKRHMGIIGTRLHMLALLIVLIFWLMGVFL